MSERMKEVKIDEKTTIGDILRPWAEKQGWKLLEFYIGEDETGLYVWATANDGEKDFQVEGQFIRP